MAADVASADSALADPPEDPPAGWVEEAVDVPEPEGGAVFDCELEEEPHPALTRAPARTQARAYFWMASMPPSLPNAPDFLLNGCALPAAADSSRALAG